jgi:hypothetical protein
MHEWYRIQLGDVKTGSTYNFGSEQGRNAILTAISMYSMMPRRMLPDNRHRNMHTWYRIQYGLTLACKYFRFRRRHIELCTTQAYFDVGQHSTRLDVIENLGVAVGIASPSCSQPNL